MIFVNILNILLCVDSLSGNSLLFPDGIVNYCFLPEYRNKSRGRIRKAMAIVTKLTCVKFEEVVYGNPTDFCVKIGNEDRKCRSYVGYDSEFPERMMMSIDTNVCTKGVIVHELFHVLGFFHEHTRPDRDDSVRIVWRNVPKRFRKNFKKVRSVTHRLPYDYYSIMHYTTNSFSKNGDATILPAVSGAETLMGQRTFPTSLDIAKINLAYRCHNHYTASELYGQ